VEFFKDAKWVWNDDDNLHVNKYVFIDPFPIESEPSTFNSTNDDPNANLPPTSN